MLPLQIISVAEFCDSAVSTRPHRETVPPERALHMVKDEANSLFDAEVAQFLAKVAPPQ